MKPDRKLIKPSVGQVRHLLILCISIAVSVILLLIRGGSSSAWHSPFKNVFTFTLFLFVILELVSLAADGRVRRRLISSLTVLGKGKGRSRNRSFTPKKALIIVLALIGISFFCVHTTYRFDLTTDPLKPTKEIALASGEILEQQITGFEEEALAAVNVRFGTYGRDNEGTVRVSLYENGNEVDSWTLPSSIFNNNVYRPLELKSVLRMHRDSQYFLRFVEEYEGENTVSVWADREVGDGYMRDGVSHNGTLCYTLTYRNTGLKTRFMLTGALIGILITALIVLNLRETAVMAVILGVLMLVFMQICPPFMAPDEENHFKRAFEVAEIGYVSDHIGETGVGGSAMPRAINEYVGLYIEKDEEEENQGSASASGSVAGSTSGTVAGSGSASGSASGSGTASSQASGTAPVSADTAVETTPSPAALPETVTNRDKEKPVIPINWNETEENAYGNTALYSPVSYLPLAAGIRIANVVSDNVPTLFYGGRWAGAIVNFLLCVLALHAAPFGKRILFLIMTFPMTIQEMVVMTPDGFTIAVCLFFLAQILRLSYRVKKAHFPDLLVLGITSLVLAQLKIVYVVLLLLLFMIPARRFSSKQTALLFKGGTAGLAVLLNLIWLKISAGFLVEFQPGVDTPAQVRYVLTHIPSYYVVCARTFVNDFRAWISTMIGSNMGALNIGMTPIIWIAAALLFIYEISTCCENRSDVHKWDPVLLIAAFLLGSALILSSLYVQWTPYMNPVILGIQGRYFTPILGTLAYFTVFMRQNRRKQQGFDPAADSMREKGTFCHLLVLFYNGIAVLDIAKFFIAQMW